MNYGERKPYITRWNGVSNVNKEIRYVDTDNKRAVSTSHLHYRSEIMP